MRSDGHHFDSELESRTDLNEAVGHHEEIDALRSEFNRAYLVREVLNELVAGSLEAGEGWHRLNGHDYGAVTVVLQGLRPASLDDKREEGCEVVAWAANVDAAEAAISHEFTISRLGQSVLRDGQLDPIRFISRGVVDNRVIWLIPQQQLDG